MYIYHTYRTVYIILPISCLPFFFCCSFICCMSAVIYHTGFYFILLEFWRFYFLLSVCVCLQLQLLLHFPLGIVLSLQKTKVNWLWWNIPQNPKPKGPNPNPSIKTVRMLFKVASWEVLASPFSLKKKKMLFVVASFSSIDPTLPYYNITFEFDTQIQHSMHHKCLIWMCLFCPQKILP